MARLPLLLVLLGLSVAGAAVFYLWPFLALFSLQQGLLVVAAGVGISLAGWLPVFYPCFRVYLARPRFPRPFAFVVVAGSLTYGGAMLTATIIGPPLELYLVYVAPQLQALGERFGEPFVMAADVALPYWWVGVLLYLLVASVAITNYLEPKWERVVSALRG